MKKLLLCIITIATISMGVYAQVPQKVKYQAVVRDGSNTVLNNQAVGMQLTLRQGSVGGLAVYTETFSTTTNAFGLVNLDIGTGTTTDDFTIIDWSAGPFFVEIAVDITGGASYSVMGTSQLMSVPYALYSETAENVINDLVDDADADSTNELQNLFVSPIGDTLYLENGGFLIIPGISEANPYPLNSIFCGGATAIVDVTNPLTGAIWMDRNLGAAQVAINSTDVDAYGDLYQWGRRSDGHQCRTSDTTSTLSSTDKPSHSDFIYNILPPPPQSVPQDWRSPQNGNLWQGLAGKNNPCPSGYRLPSDAELDTERLSWSSNDAAGAFASPLKLPSAGYRSPTDASLIGVGSYAALWSNTLISSSSRRLDFGSLSSTVSGSSRGTGYSVRCIKD